MEENTGEKDTKRQEENQDSHEMYRGVRGRYVLYAVFAVLLMIVLFFLADILSPVTTFAVYNPDKTEYYLDNLEELVSFANSNLDKVPSTLRWAFGDERIDLTLIKIDGSRVKLAVTTEDGWVKSIQKGDMQDPTMRVEIMETTMKRITESGDPSDELNNALDSGEIKYDNERFISSVKMLILETTVSLMSLLS